MGDGRHLACAVILVLGTSVGACGGGGGGNTVPTGPMLAAQFVPTTLDANSVFNDQAIGQTFTAAVTGRIGEIEMLISQDLPGQDLVILILPVVAELPNNDWGTSMGGGRILDGTLPANAAWAKIDLTSENIQVTAGQSYAVCLRTAPTAAYTWVGSPVAGPNGYTGGTGCFRNPAVVNWTTAHPVDLGFRVWVTP